jgi:hypothetical protein
MTSDDCRNPDGVDASDLGDIDSSTSERAARLRGLSPDPNVTKLFCSEC